MTVINKKTLPLVGKETTDKTGLNSKYKREIAKTTKYAVLPLV
ncbi:MAG TPA: hypothetical protein PKL88_00295 [bacterium]|nr:hypothetical protein [bacterium]